MKEKENSFEFLDKKTCDRVMQDMQICIDDWSRQDLDTRAAVVTLTRFAVEIAFKFSHTSMDAMQLISSLVYDSFSDLTEDELNNILVRPETTNTIH